MTEPKLSECCGARVEKIQGYTNNNIIVGTINGFYLVCSKCGKPCTMASKPEFLENVLAAERTYNITASGKHSKPDERLLTAEERFTTRWVGSFPYWQTQVEKETEAKLLQAQDAKTYPLAFEAGVKSEKGIIALKLQEAMNAIPSKRLAQVENLLTDLFKEAK